MGGQGVPQMISVTPKAGVEDGNLDPVAEKTRLLPFRCPQASKLLPDWTRSTWVCLIACQCRR